MTSFETSGGMGYVLSEDKKVIDVYFRIPNAKELLSRGINIIHFEENSHKERRISISDWFEEKTNQHFEESWELMKDWWLGELDDEFGFITKHRIKGANFRHIIEPLLTSYLLIDPGEENEEEWGENLTSLCEWYAVEQEIEGCTFIKVSLLFCDFALERVKKLHSDPSEFDGVIGIDWALHWRQKWTHSSFAFIDVEEYEKKYGQGNNIQDELDGKFKVQRPTRKEFLSLHFSKSNDNA
jgi:hypothetical protein